MSFTIILILLTALTSYFAFNNSTLFNNLILYPKIMKEPKEYYRLITSGFIHADYMHLLFNMMALYFFGRVVEAYYTMSGINILLFLVLYLLGIVVASLPSFAKNMNNSYYRSLGASGGVGAVLFAFVYFAPWQIIYVWFIPIPGIIAAVGYLMYSAYMSKKGMDNVNHDAHFYGAVFGFIFTLIVAPDHGSNFLIQLMHPQFNF